MGLFGMDSKKRVHKADREKERVQRNAYSAMQKACGIEVGDTVLVTSKCENYQSGWGTYWNGARMDAAVGKEDVVVKIGNKLSTGDSGFVLEGGGNNAFPCFVLQLVRKGPAPEVTTVVAPPGESDYGVTYDNDGQRVRIGCANVSLSDVEGIHAHMKELSRR